MSADPLSAFRRGNDRDRDRRAEHVTPDTGTDEVDVDGVLERRRSELLQSTLTAPPPTTSEPVSTPPGEREPQVANIVTTTPSAPTRPSPPAAHPLGPPPTSNAAGRVRRPAVYNVSKEVAHGLRVLRGAREQDYPLLIATALDEAAAKVPVAPEAIRKRNRFSGERITVELDPSVREAIKTAAQERNLNASAFVTQLLEQWIPSRVLRGQLHL
jgi:hypothetical protein